MRLNVRPRDPSLDVGGSVAAVMVEVVGAAVVAAVALGAAVELTGGVVTLTGGEVTFTGGEVMLIGGEVAFHVWELNKS